ncbi:MAG: VWA domain-containing protein [Bacteroidota bacterium]
MDRSSNTVENWISLRWFKPSVLQSFEWQNTYVLYLLAVIPILLLLRWIILNQFGSKLTIALSRKEIKSDPSSYLRFIPPLFMIIASALILLSLARPQKTNEQVDQWTEGIDIMLVLDISQSMEIEDFKPNRLEAAKQTALDFIDGRFQDRIGVVVFSGDAYSLSPLTTDYDLLRSYIETINFDLIETSGTAIGSALAVATNRMRESDSNSKVMILLSDGDNNAGNLDPITSAQLAAAYGIKIYTIGVGKEGRVPYGKDFFGRTNYVENQLDETTLREIAKIGEGNFYRVSNNEALKEVFSIIDKFEKAEIKETRYKDTTDYYPIYLRWAILFFLIWLAFKSTPLTNVLQD